MRTLYSDWLALSDIVSLNTARRTNAPHRTKTTKRRRPQNLRLELDATVAVITIDRPQVLNALNSATLAELRRAMLDVQGDRLFRLVASTDDMKEGTAAFLEKRRPELKGR